MSLPLDSPAINSAFQDWKYWKTHPFSTESRGHVFHRDGQIISHGGRWPIRLQTEFGELESFHLIDWAADRNCAGAGMAVLRACSESFSAVFSIGGSAATQTMVSAFGFRPKNLIWFLRRPLHPWHSASNPASANWKTIARFARDSVRSFHPRIELEAGWSYQSISPPEIPERLFPKHITTDAVSMRNARLLEQMKACPLFTQSRVYTVSNASTSIAYFMLAQVGSEARVIDFGPATLTAEESKMLGTCTQLAARRDFASAAVIATATTEPTVREGFISSGFRKFAEKPIRVLALSPVIRKIEKFRLTLIDWDACCL